MSNNSGLPLPPIEGYNTADEFQETGLSVSANEKRDRSADKMTSVLRRNMRQNQRTTRFA